MHQEYLARLEPQYFQQAVLAWYGEYGRKNLPWKTDSTAYKIWISEIMLQQTQVNTVIPYFLRFMRRFPTLAALSDAELEEVLQHWSGLGYYARARNLHNAAQTMVRIHDATIPATLEQLTALPGIGRSTAGAILSMGYGIRAAILDGNVKRILSRYIGLRGWPGESGNQRLLWACGEMLTPENRSGDFNQALMDLGATLCSRSRPSCSACPLSAGCSAHRLRQTDSIPAPKPRSSQPARKTWMLILYDANGACYLEKRPAAGLWGGLWVFPSFDSETELLHWCRLRQVDDTRLERWPEQRHTFSHFHLDYTPVVGQVASFGVIQDSGGAWLQAGEAHAVPAPVYRLLENINRKYIL